jgi:hypothetical protein
MEKDSGMKMSYVVVMFNMCGWEGDKRGQWGLARGLQMGVVDSDH